MSRVLVLSHLSTIIVFDDCIFSVPRAMLVLEVPGPPSLPFRELQFPGLPFGRIGEREDSAKGWKRSVDHPLPPTVLLASKRHCFPSTRFNLVNDGYCLSSWLDC